MIVGVAGVVSGDRTFSEGKSVYHRERSAGINTFSFFMVSCITM
jgi:hypothetical protein